MSQLELLKLVLSVLDQLDIDAMVVGSHASSYYGEARTTHDVDLLIALEPTRAVELIQAFEPARYYISDQAILEGRLANIIDLQTGDKIDLFLSQPNSRDRKALRRRRTVHWLGTEIPMITPEDLIVAKLKWGEMLEGSDRQNSDILGVLKRQRGKLDAGHLERELETDGLGHLWLALKEHL